MYSSTLRRHACLFAFLPLLWACTGKSTPDTAEQARQDIETARRDAAAMEQKLAALPPACTLGTAHGEAGAWVDAPHARAEPGQPFVYHYAFDKTVTGRAFHVALNRKAWRSLDKVEARDARGEWTVVWAGTLPEAPAECEYLRLEQAFANGPRQVDAMRFSFYPGPETITAADAGVLPAG
ncbi:hypothetical protein HH212_02940 [Massilia forsythiae]|uniref:Lipoprotein n=1 Tax=Massilia forsythiae TaxID=2728020 RepID=A0A7Z2VTY4_9BURK|nr:hypothetical protein [Massilia forsythiae]QJD99118.1 hypothetical protein HH212_02940 [Massilia forsythiae]